MKLFFGTLLFAVGLPIGIILLPITTIVKVWNPDLGMLWICDWAWDNFIR